MQDHPSCRRQEPADEDYVDRAVLVLLLNRHPAPMPIDDFVRALALADERPVLCESSVREGISRLVSDGLALRYGDLVLATQAAVRSHQVDL